jgi:hypothetical protein
MNMKRNSLKHYRIGDRNTIHHIIWKVTKELGAIIIIQYENKFLENIAEQCGTRHSWKELIHRTKTMKLKISS